MDVYVAPTNIGMETDGGMFNPSVFQGNDNSCAIHSQYHVLKDYGYTGTVEDLKVEAEYNGWYDPATGTSPENVGKLLEAHGVPCNVYVNANEYNLISELAQGKRVIVGVDSGEIWNDEGVLQDFWEKITGGGADHAVVVSGINTADPDNIKVVLTDSGAGHAAIEYPLDKFMDAWKDGECTMWVPQEPPKQEYNLDRLINFDWDLGHLANVGDMSYDDIVSYQIEEGDFIEIDITDSDIWWEDVLECCGIDPQDVIYDYTPAYEFASASSFDVPVAELAPESNSIEEMLDAADQDGAEGFEQEFNSDGQEIFE